MYSIRAKRIIIMISTILLFELSWWIVWKNPETSQLLKLRNFDQPWHATGTADLSRLAHLYFPKDKVFHINSIAYDFYSIWELGQPKLGHQWLTLPLPHEINKKENPIPWHPISSSVSIPIRVSPLTKTRIAYLEQVYVISDVNFVDRHEHLKKVFRRQSIPDSSIDWIWKWNRTTCNAHKNFDEVYRKKLNMKSGVRLRNNMCPIIMKHVDAWHDVVKNQIKLALILEDDSLFVPFFKEKLDRVIYTAIRIGAFRINSSCLIFSQNRTMKSNEWINQEPMFVLGACINYHDQSFKVSVPNAQPLLTTHKMNPSRCAHAYMITECSARAMLGEIAAKPTEVDTPDFLMNYLFPRSPVLQSIWIDPPLVYQGNRVTDLEFLQTFRETKYQQK